MPDCMHDMFNPNSEGELLAKYSAKCKAYDELYKKYKELQESILKTGV